MYKILPNSDVNIPKDVFLLYMELLSASALDDLWWIIELCRLAGSCQMFHFSVLFDTNLCKTVDFES